MERLLLPGKVIGPGEPGCLLFDIRLQATYPGGDRVALFPRYRKIPLKAGEPLLYCRDRLPIKIEIGEGYLRSAELGLQACEELSFCFKRSSHPRDLFEADAELERPPMRLFGAVELLGEAHKPILVKREALLLAPDLPQPRLKLF